MTIAQQLQLILDESDRRLRRELNLGADTIQASFRARRQMELDLRCLISALEGVDQ